MKLRYCSILNRKFASYRTLTWQGGRDCLTHWLNKGGGNESVAREVMEKTVEDEDTVIVIMLKMSNMRAQTEWRKESA